MRPGSKPGSNITCTLPENIDDCELVHDACRREGACHGHVVAACGEPAVYTLAGPDYQQYACTDHLSDQLQNYPDAVVTDRVQGVLLIFRQCPECEHQIACLWALNPNDIKAPESCADHS